MRKDSARPTATIHPFPVRPKAIGATAADTASAFVPAAPGGSVACFDSWYHDEAVQAALAGPDPLAPGPRLRPV